MRKFRYIIAALTALCIGFISCVKDNKEAEILPAPEVYDQGFSLGTRADGDESGPKHGDTYTLMAYRKAYQNSTTADSYEIRNTSSMLQYGYYAYDKDGVVIANNLIPVAVNATTYETATPLARSQVNGMRLVGIPVTGTNSTNQGYYYVTMIHPAIPVRNSEHGYLAVFNRTDDIYVSHPDDKSGDGDATNDPFEIEVHNNMDVHDATGVKLFPVKAAIRVYLYSHFYADDDDYTNDLHVDFSVENLTGDLKLVNAGRNGWFNPRTGVIYPNYNYQNQTIYSNTLGVSYDGQNAEPLTTVVDNTNDIPTLYGDKTATAKYLIDNVPVFPTDYRGGEGGGNPFIIPMTLSLKLKQGSVYNNASVPIALNIERNKVYTFYVNVKSTMVAVSYSVSDWDTAGGTYGDLGSEVMPYMNVKLQGAPGGWTEQNAGSNTIGD